jgi:hypothetical protein
MTIISLSSLSSFSTIATAVGSFFILYWSKLKIDLSKIKTEASAVVTAVENGVKADVTKLKALL